MIKMTNVFALLLGQLLNEINLSLTLKIIFLHENIEFYESSCLMRWFRILGTNYWNVIREDHAQDDSLSEPISGSTKSPRVYEPVVEMTKRAKGWKEEEPRWEG